MPTSQLEQLRTMTTIIVDSGDFDTIKSFAPSGATTNPSLVLQAAQKPEYRFLIERAVAESKKEATPERRRDLLIDSLFVLFGVELLKIVPDRVSTEVDAALSFDARASVERAVQLISLYGRYGIPKERVLIKLAATPEGVRAAEVLEKIGINCNMTLIFSLVQAVACAEVNATLVSPFVGRVLDWYKARHPSEAYPAEKDPGVALVRSIYRYFKTFGLKTVVMGASFRNKEEVLALAGCDLLTISPKLLGELASSSEPTVFYEYMIETAALAKKEGIKNIFKTGGFINADPLNELCNYLDAANVDLKGFDKKYLNDICAEDLDVVLEGLKTKLNSLMSLWKKELPSMKKS